MNRRRFNLWLGLALAGIGGGAVARDAGSFEERCKELEAGLGGRLGVSCIDTGSGRVQAYRADERFPMCSTFKWLAAAAVLGRVDAGRERLDRRIVFGKDEVLEWSPATESRTGGEGMTLAELCDAAIALSDNTAGNLLLKAVGGLDEWNRYLRSIGDNVTRLDRYEPFLNESRPGDARDTTTPAAMTADLRRLLLGDALSPASREQLKQWMLGTKTSGARLRADLPAGWRLADKTGTGNFGTANDVGVLWPASGSPIVVSVYITQASAERKRQEAAIATVARWQHQRG